MTGTVLDEAEAKIAGILADLEHRAGAIVESIRVIDVQVTTVIDDRPQLMRRVVVELRPVPGTRWERVPVERAFNEPKS